MRRNDLVLRARTNVSQSLPKDLEDKSFKVSERNAHQNSDYPYDLICNMDETPIFFFVFFFFQAQPPYQVEKLSVVTCSGLRWCV